MIKKLLKKLSHRIPSLLPVGDEEFLKFYQDIISTYGYPDKPGYKELIGTLIQHTKEDQIKIPKYWFAKAIRKAQANETAYWCIQAAKKEAQEGLKEETKPEVTTMEITSESAAVN